VGFLRNAADRVEAGIARIHAEEQQKLLNAELGHRLKNTFAMVQAIAVQTFRGVTDQANITAFIQRIHALSAAQDELVEQNWTSAKLDLVVPKALGSFCDVDRFEISGPSVELGPRSTLSVSLLLHELVTNAMKHGALSAEAGKVRVHWEITSFGSETELLLEWVETGGPVAQPPTRKGFGSKLIAMGLVGTGGVDLRYLPSGFIAAFKAPLSQVQAS
jgi:two-component sensor histidine kinase